MGIDAKSPSRAQGARERAKKEKNTQKDLWARRVYTDLCWNQRNRAPGLGKNIDWLSMSPVKDGALFKANSRIIESLEDLLSDEMLQSEHGQELLQSMRADALTKMQALNKMLLASEQLEHLYEIDCSHDAVMDVKCSNRVVVKVSEREPASLKSRMQRRLWRPCSVGAWLFVALKGFMFCILFFVVAVVADAIEPDTVMRFILNN